MLTTEQRWTDLCQRLGARDNPKIGRTIKSTYIEIVLAYTQPGRFYHNLDHIDHGLSELDKIRQLATSPDELEMAWWWHDFFYKPRYPFNELESSVSAFKALTELSIDPRTCLNIVRRIIPTLHSYIPPEYDDWLMVDIDLSQLGAPPEIFAQNTANIRKEFPQVSDIDFARGTAEFFKKFLKNRSFSGQPTVYLTDHFREQYEVQAQKNLERLIVASPDK